MTSINKNYTCTFYIYRMIGVQIALELICIFPATNGHFFNPGYPTLHTAIQFDRTGTTRIGKYVLNHSFMLPGIITAASAVIAGLILKSILL
jgi:anaerobic C4-dicarboxylate transporter DcuA